MKAEGVYPQELTEKYTSLRGTFAWTDTKVLKLIEGLDIGGKRVLDLGSGDGRYALRLREMGAGEIVGVDISPAMVAKAEQLLEEHPTPDISFMEADSSALPFPPDSFDFVFSNFVFHHCSNTLASFQEVARVLRGGGSLLATFNTFEVEDEFLLNTEVPLLLGRDEVVEVHNLVKTDGEVKKNLELSGLKTVYYENQGHPYLKISPGYDSISSIKKVNTIICLARKEGRS